MSQAKTVPELFQKTKEDWLLQARKVAQELLYERDHITIMDVLQVCPFPDYLGRRARNTIGNVFHNDTVFRPIGYTTATTPASHAHVIRIWTLREEYYPQSMLAYRRRQREDYENE